MNIVLDVINKKSTANINTDLMKIFDCDPSWPVCLFDFTFDQKIINQ